MDSQVQGQGGAVLEATWGIEGSWDRQLRRHGGQFWGHFEAWRAVGTGSFEGNLGHGGQPEGQSGSVGAAGGGNWV